MPTSAYLPPITPTQLALHHTRFSNWFPLYRRHSPKATVIDLLSIQTDFVDWLEEDGIVLPKDSEEEEYSIDRISLNDLNGNDDGEQEEEEEEEAEPRNFDPLNERIRQVLSTYEGAVFPKLDWSAPLVRFSFFFLFLALKEGNVLTADLSSGCSMDRTRFYFAMHYSFRCLLATQIIRLCLQGSCSTS